VSLVLDINNEQEAMPISDALVGKLKELLALVGEQEGIESGEVSLSFVDDETIRELNRTYRGLDKPTDVLSFALSEMGEDEPDILYEVEEDESAQGEDLPTDALGDIVISVPRAIAQAEEYGHSVEREIGFLFVHGFLHLLGYDHGTEEDEKVMFSKQEAVLQQAGLTR